MNIATVALNDTVQSVIALIESNGGQRAPGGMWIGGLPAQSEVVSLLAAHGIKAQTTNVIVTEADWRDEDFGNDGSRPLNCLYVYLRCDYASEDDCADEDEDDCEDEVCAVFDYINNNFSYC